MGVCRGLAVVVLAFVLPFPANADDLKLTPGVAVASDGAQVRYEVGTLRVPENRARPASRQIGVGVLRIRARVPAGAPPIFLLVGGPGVTLLDTLADPGPAARRRLRMWLDYSESADLVIVEQRGYTLRGEMFELKNPAMPLDRPARVEDDVALTLAQARAAAAEHPGVDLSGYTIAECADDVDAARRLLGYDRISLMGASFGSQWSFAVMRRHPETVARALISAVEPLDNGYDMPSHVFAALQRIAFEAERDPALAPFIPKGGLIAAARTIRDRFAKAPVTVQLDNAGAVTLGLGDFQLALREQAVDAAVWPAFVIDLYNGRYQAWARQVVEQRKASTVSLIGPLIDTATGISAAREAQLRTDPALDMLGSWNFAAYLASAEAWPTEDLGDAFRLPVPNPTPVLFVQGDWDTNTPVENLTGLLPYFPNARAILVHRGQHTGALALLRDQPQLMAAAMRFLKDGSVDGLPAEAALASVRFALPQEE